MNERLRSFPEDERPKPQRFEGNILGRARGGKTERNNPLYTFDISITTEKGSSRRTVVRKRALTNEIRSRIIKDEKVTVVGIPYVVRRNKKGRGNVPLYRISATQIIFSDGTRD